MSRIGAFVLGGLVGFSFGVYHGYNYALDQHKKELYQSKIKYERKIGYSNNSKTLENLVLVKNNQTTRFVGL